MLLWILCDQRSGVFRVWQDNKKLINKYVVDNMMQKNMLNSEIHRPMACQSLLVGVDLLHAFIKSTIVMLIYKRL